MKAWKIIHTHPREVDRDRAVLERLGQDPALPAEVRMVLGMSVQTSIHPLLAHSSRLWEHPGALRHVLQNGLSPDIRDENGLTPLFIAMGLAPAWGSSTGFIDRHWFHVQSVGVLVEEGADLLYALGLPNASGVRSAARNALGWAERFSLGEMLSLLRPATEQCLLEKSLAGGASSATPRKRL
jgi:hypothetical protein